MHAVARFSEELEHGPRSLLGLLRRGGRTDVRGADGETPLHLACEPARPMLLRPLLEHPGDVDAAAARDGLSAAARLCARASDKQVRCLQLLLRARASIELPAMGSGGQPTTLLHLAVRSGQPRQLEVRSRRISDASRGAPPLHLADLAPTSAGGATPAVRRRRRSARQG